MIDETFYTSLQRSTVSTLPKECYVLLIINCSQMVRFSISLSSRNFRLRRAFHDSQAFLLEAVALKEITIPY